MVSNADLVDNKNKQKSIRDLIDDYLKYWPWFLIITIISLSIAVLYLKFTIPTYKAVASIIIKDEENSSSPERSLYADLGLLGGMGTNSIANELGLLKSKRLMTNVVNALHLNVQYFDPDDIPAKELYLSSPFLIEVISLQKNLLSKAIKEEKNSFNIQKSGTEVVVSVPDSDKEIRGSLGSLIDLGYISFIVKETYDPTSDDSTDPAVLVEINYKESIVNRYRSKLDVSLLDENSTLIQLSVTDPVIAKAEDILNQLIFEYNKEAIDDKNLIAKNTASFINDRLKIINRELDSVEVGKEDFKELNKLTNIEAESNIILQNASEYENKRLEANTQLGLVDAMISYLDNKEIDLLPTNLGIEENSINQMIDQFNVLVLERNRLLAGSTAINPLVITLNNQIEQLQKNVRESLLQKRSSILITQRDLQRQSGRIGSQIAEVPSQERQFRGIERQQNVKESLYLFLLQKREENSLSLAATAPKAKIVDRAYGLYTPVSPNSSIVLFVSALAGLAIPFLFINLFFILNNKVQSKEDIQNYVTGIPIIGEIPHINKSDKDLVGENDRSLLSETFRILLSNLYYVQGNKSEEDAYCIFVTSSIKGEGKTLTAANIAKILAINDKKTLLIGGDLRNPQLHKYEPMAKDRKGVSNYLASDQEELSELILDSTLHGNLKILPSGPVPPNPAELLGKHKAERLFQELKSKFDYIIVDTAPSMILADTFLINQFSDLTIYMIRAGFSEKKLLDLPIEAKRTNKLKNIAIVLNDVKLKNFGYGKKYEYTYGESTKHKRKFGIFKK